MNPIRETHQACGGFSAQRFARRRLLAAGGLGLLGLTLPRLLRAEAAPAASRPKARAKSVIFLFQFGGPSHIDMFDMKPDAPEGIRGPYRPIPTSAPGILVSERLPNVARIMNRVTLVRSMHHEMKNHNSASYYALTGHAPPVDDIRLSDTMDLFPAYGSVASLLGEPRDDVKDASGGGRRREMPAFVSYPHVLRDGSVTPGQHASFLGKSHDPFFISEDPNSPSFRLPELSLPSDLPLSRLEKRREMQKLIDRQSRLLEYSSEAQGLDAFYTKALEMLHSEAIRSAFDLSSEPDWLRDRYGRHTYGQGCLLARRLVEAGTRFVTVYFSESIGGQSKVSGGWDTHGFNNTRMFPIIEALHLPITDQTLPALIEDLDQRGLLEDTLVVWMGEFGRTPKLNGNVSRDHWPQCYTALLAGGGVKRGHVHGASDGHGSRPASDPVRPDDLAATIFHLLGIDPATEVRGPGERPLLIAEGDPVLDIIA